MRVCVRVCVCASFLSCVCMCLCGVCVCVCEREREREYIYSSASVVSQLSFDLSQRQACKAASKILGNSMTFQSVRSEGVSLANQTKARGSRSDLNKFEKSFCSRYQNLSVA